MSSLPGCIRTAMMMFGFGLSWKRPGLRPLREPLDKNIGLLWSGILNVFSRLGRESTNTLSLLRNAIAAKRRAA